MFPLVNLIEYHLIIFLNISLEDKEKDNYDLNVENPGMSSYASVVV